MQPETDIAYLIVYFFLNHKPYDFEQKLKSLIVFLFLLNLGNQSLFFLVFETTFKYSAAEW